MKEYTMKKYIVMPEDGNWKEVEATSHEMAYRGMCYWYIPSTKIFVMDKETGVSEVFTREIGPDGNLNVVNKLYGGC